MKKLLLIALLAFTATVSAQLANDECSGAIEIPINSTAECSATLASTNIGATQSTDAETCAETPLRDVWFKFTATFESHYLNTTVPANTPAKRHILYSGTCGNLMQMNCYIVSNTTRAKLEGLIPGQVYYIRTFDNLSNSAPNTFTLCINTVPAVTTSSSYTTQQLVENVLMNSSCVVVSNITSGGAPGTTPSIGYFNKNTSPFSLNKGVILSTGAIANAPGPNTSNQSQGQTAPWAGDADLTAIMASMGGIGDSFLDATKLEFDFIPQIDHISFNYVFASEEYGTFQCNYADAFAFILTDMVTGEVKNLAVVPNSTTPVSVITIRDNQYNNSCSSQNAQYFGAYYQPTDIFAPVNFNGVTVPLTAQSNVVPGRQYHIKLVIADRSDSAFDSAVFIDGGSFNIGGLDSGYIQLTSSAGTVLCNGQSTTLSVNGGDTLNYVWTKDGEIVLNQTSSSLTVTEAGTYTVTISVGTGAGCSLEYSIVIHSATAGTAPELADMWVYEPNSDGMYPFDFTSQTAAITNMTGYGNMMVTYHLTEADAQANVNPLTSPYINIANPQDIYVRIQNPNNSCYVVSQFSIGAVDENYQTPPPTGSGIQGFAPGDTLADIEIEGENIQWYDNPGSGATGKFTTDSVDTPLPLTTLLVDGMTYYASQTKFGRESLQRLPVTIDAAMSTGSVNFKNFNYRPNPVKDVLQLSNGASIDNVEIYNIVGQKVKSENGGKTGLSVDLSSLTNGVYVVKVTSANAEKTIKIVKQ